MKRKISYDNLITIIVAIFLFGHLIFNLLFESGDKIFKIILIFLAVITMKIIFSYTFIKKSKIIYVFGLVFIIMSIYLGNILNIYTYIPRYDKILHFASGIILGILGFIMYLHFEYEKNNKLNHTLALVFTLIFAIAMAAVWEIWEFSTDQLLGFTSQHNSLIDTMTDIICGTFGGITVLIPIYIHMKFKKIKFLEVIIKEMEKQ